MAKFNEEDTVFIPVSKVEKQVPDLTYHSYAFYQGRVNKIEGKCIISEYRNTPIKVGSAVCQKNIGILILTIGDLETEVSLLDPLTKSVLQYCRLLVPDDYLKSYKIRTVKELKFIWEKEHKAYSHIIIVGHGSTEGIYFNEGQKKLIEAEKLRELFDFSEDVSKKVFVSLCCLTGRKGIADIFSNMECCSYFIGPHQNVHGAIASQFVQTLLSYHFISGNSINVAYKNAKNTTPRGNFRLWKNGSLENSPHKPKK